MFKRLQLPKDSKGSGERQSTIHLALLAWSLGLAQAGDLTNPSLDRQTGFRTHSSLSQYE